MKQLVLASGSAGRREILSKTQFPFIVDVSDYEEDMTLDMRPQELAVYLALGKGRTVAKRHKNAVILSADSFCIFGKELLGKPHTIERAKEMLNTLSGNTHSFVTGFAIIDADTGKEYTAFEETKIYFRDITATEIDHYLAKDDVLAKAGAYTIQGLGSAFITKIEGDYSNVVGLPLSAVTLALTNFGINLI